MKRFFSVLLSAAVLLSCFISAPVNAASAAQIIAANGGFESAYIEWAPVTGADGYNVYCAALGGGSFTKIDDELIRVYDGYMRADVLGLSSGDYVIKVIPTKGGTEQTALEAQSGVINVMPHGRDGFAFSDNSPNKTSSGAYNDDGTLKSDADVLYVTNGNKDAVTLGGDPSLGVGLTEILAYRQSKKVSTPLAIRLIGKVDEPAGTVIHTAQFQNTGNITLEGVGDDATIFGWIMTLKRTNNFEIRNIAMMYGGEGTTGSAIVLDTDNKNVWVHNCDFFYGAPGKDADQKKGDGAVDLKSRSDYVTIDYNHFWDLGKTCVSGGPWENSNMYDERAHVFVTYHHNWFDHTDSRHPRCVVGSNHVYNNYYDGNAMYGIGAAMKTSVFSEANYYRNCPRPMIIASQGSDCYDLAAGTYKDKGTLSGQMGGMIKSYGDVIVSPQRFYPYGQEPDAGEFDAYVASARDEKVPETVTAKKGDENGCGTYNNFDTDPDIMYEYEVDTPEEAVEKIKKYAGRLGGGDFKWTFNNETDDPYHDIDEKLLAAIKGYTSKLVSVPAIPYVEPEPSPSQQPSESASPEPSKGPITPVGSEVEHNFTQQNLTSDFFEFNDMCVVKSGKDTIQYGEMTLTKCLELGSSTTFSFTAPKDGQCTFIMSTTKSVSAGVNGQRVNGDAANGILTFDLASGESYTITKGGGTGYLFYIAVEFEGGGAAYEYEIESAAFDANGKLCVTLKANQDVPESAVLIAAAYGDDKVLSHIKSFDIKGTEITGLDFDKPSAGIVKLFIWNSIDGMIPLGEAAEAK